MSKRFSNLLFSLFSAFLTFVPSIAIADVRSEVEKIKTDPQYIFGEAWADSPGEADKLALANLLGNIGTTVESSFTIDSEETIGNNGEIESKQNAKSFLNTYSQATINNTQTKTYNDGKNGFYLIRYMKLSELEKMFAHRKDRVDDYVRSALRSEEKGRVDDALRFFNWAYVLLHSLQYPSEVRMKINGKDELLIHWIPSKMKEILKNIDVSVANLSDDNEMELVFKYKGTPAEGLDFTYWNGRINSPITGIKDGIGKISFPIDYKPNEIILVVETSYSEASMSDRELEMMIRNFKQLNFPDAKKTIGNGSNQIKVEKNARKDLQAIVEAGKNNGVTALDKKGSKEFDVIIKDIIKDIRDKKYSPNEEYFTSEGLQMYKALLDYGSATIIGNPDPGFYPLGDRVICRSVPMQFKFKNNNRSFVEDVTFTFSPEKKIESVAFGLGAAARRDVFSQGGDVWGDSIKMVIVTFLENYKTAFALKRLDYIKSIFDDNAYIIVGHKLHKIEKASGDVKGLAIKTDYSFQRKTKDEYINQLERCFNSNEFVNINFSDNDIQKAAFGGNTFGIQIKQDYYSQHYGDQGYLFLFVDLNEADKPIIKIRTWQPERNPNITPMIPKDSRDYGIYGIYSFD